MSTSAPASVCDDGSSTTTYLFDTPDCKGAVQVRADLAAANVEAVLKRHVPGGRVEYIAAAPGDRRLSFTGSMLPAASAEQAFHNTPIRGSTVVGAGRRLSLTIPVPNSYYTATGTQLVPPTLYILFHDGMAENKVAIPVAPAIANRSLTYPGTRSDAGFYGGLADLPVRTQEQVLRGSAMCNARRSPTFWGARPPV